MASLMARVRGAAGQVPVEFDKRGKPVLPEDTTSVFIRGRKADGKRGQIGPSYEVEDIDTAVAARAAIEAQEKAGKLVGDFVKHAAPAPAVAAGTWVNLLARYRDNMDGEVLKGIVKASTQNRYNQILNIFNAYITDMGVTNLKDINEDFTEGYKRYRIKSGAPKGYIMDTKVLHHIFTYGKKKKLMMEIPIVSETQEVSEEGKPFLPEELERMEKVLVNEKGSVDDTFVFALLRWTGLRIGDAADLRWRDINDRKGRIVRITEKSRNRKKKTADLAIRPELRAALDAELKWQTELLGGIPTPDSYVVLNKKQRNGKGYNKHYADETTLGKHIAALGERAGVEDVHCHRFRHTFVEFLYLQGLESAQIAPMIGDSVATVEKYYSKYSLKRREQADRLFMGEPSAAA